jgi:plasmid stabilization system protein ParE
MRTVRYSLTFTEQFHALLTFGAEQFGPDVVLTKQARVLDTIETFLAEHPDAKRPVLGLTRYPIQQTPFVVVYEYDDNELRVHFIFHHSADLRTLDPKSARW